MIRNESFVEAPSNQIPGTPLQWEMTFPLPSRCPNCAQLIEPKPMAFSYLNLTGNGQFATVSLRCDQCRLCYAAFYHVQDARNKCQFLGTYPNLGLVEVRGELLMLSPRFVELYRQAAEAEASGNLELAHMGMSCAVRALLRDYHVRLMGVGKSKAAGMPIKKALKALPNLKLLHKKRTLKMLQMGYLEVKRKCGPKQYRQLAHNVELIIESTCRGIRKSQKHA